jgi:hypothetical protein
MIIKKDEANLSFIRIDYKYLIQELRIVLD